MGSNNKKILAALLITFGILAFTILIYTYFFNNKKMSTNTLNENVLIAKLNLPKLEGVKVHINEIIDRKYTCDGININPEIEFPEKGIYAVLVEDPDAPAGTWFHWGIVIWNTDKIDEGLEKVSEGKNFYQTHNDFYYYNFLTDNIKGTGYDGPCPPKGHGYHRYFFEIFKLKKKPEFPIKEKEEIKAFIEENAESATYFVGKYKRE
jgi:Raf kinase inhibitor-like YbhB/YbcL family protein